MEFCCMTEGNGCINCGGDGCDACFDTMSGELFEDVNLAENWNEELFGDIN